MEHYQHLVGESYIDDESLLEFVTTRVTKYQGLIVAYRAPILSSGSVGVEEKSPIHVAEVVRMMGIVSSSRLRKESRGRDASGRQSAGVQPASGDLARTDLSGSGRREEHGRMNPRRDPSSGDSTRRRVRFEQQVHDEESGPKRAWIF